MFQRLTSQSEPSHRAGDSVSARWLRRRRPGRGTRQERTGQTSSPSSVSWSLSLLRAASVSARRVPQALRGLVPAFAEPSGCSSHAREAVACTSRHVPTALDDVSAAPLIAAILGNRRRVTGRPRATPVTSPFRPPAAPRHSPGAGTGINTPHGVVELTLPPTDYEREFVARDRSRRLAAPGPRLVALLLGSVLLVLRPRRSARAVPEDSAGVSGGEAPVDLPACAIGRLVPKSRAVLELAKRRDPIAPGALA